MKIRSILLMSGILFSILLSGCAKETEKEHQVKEVILTESEVPRLTRVERRDIIMADIYDGDVFYKTVQLSFPQKGNFEIYKVKLLEAVSKGQVLATTIESMSTSEYENLKKTVDDLKNNYSNDEGIKKLELERLEIELEVIYKTLEETAPNDSKFLGYCRQAGEKYRAIEAKKLELKQLKETYDLEYGYYYKKMTDYKKTMGKNKIIAPFDGTVTALNNIQSGAYVDPDKYYIALTDPYVLCAYTKYMTEKYISTYDEIYAVINGERFDVEYVPSDADLHLRLVTEGKEDYSAFIIKDPSTKASAGDLCKIVVVRDKSENVVSVPRNALYGDILGRFVYVYGAEGREKRYVKIGITDGLYYEIREGLSEGEVIYAEK